MVRALDTGPHALTLPRLLHAQKLNLFYGDLHNHTGYSDGMARPEDALRQMRDRGLPFAAITALDRRMVRRSKRRRTCRSA